MLMNQQESNVILSVMINGKEIDLIENRPFDKCFIKSKIKYASYKVRFVPFTRILLMNTLVLHDLDEKTNESDNLIKLQDDYIATTIEAEKLVFNKFFTARLPKIR